MGNEALDLSPLRRAVGALKRSCGVWAALPEEQRGSDMAETLRARRGGRREPPAPSKS